MNRDAALSHEPRAATGWSTLDSLKELAEASDALRRALTKRDTEAILAITETQERLALSFDSHTSVFATSTGHTQGERQELSALAAGIKRTQRTNRALAETFLLLINRTLSRVSGTGQPGECIYGASGSLDPARSPLLITKKG